MKESRTSGVLHFNLASSSTTKLAERGKERESPRSGEGRREKRERVGEEGEGVGRGRGRGWDEKKANTYSPISRVRDIDNLNDSR